jgi:hypothetical protein
MIINYQDIGSVIGLNQIGVIKEIPGENQVNNLVALSLSFLSLIHPLLEVCRKNVLYSLSSHDLTT